MHPQHSNSDVMMDLSSQGILSVKNEGAAKLLQGQLTCDITDISSLTSRLGAHCNPQGRMISLFRICWFQDQYLLLMPSALLPIAMAALKKYAPFFKVDLLDESHSYKKIGYTGQNLVKAIPTLPLQINDVVTIEDLLIIKVSDSPSRYEILGKKEVVEEKWQQCLVHAQVESENTWKRLDLENSIPSLYPETSEKFLPHDINLPALEGVSFKKGCYTGQEIIARMHYKGKLKNRLFLASAETSLPPERGGIIYRGKDSCGSIVDYCQVSYTNYELLIIAPESDAANTLSLDPESNVILNFR